MARPALWPRFPSRLHTPVIAARLGLVLGTCLLVCFVTGLLSHYQYASRPWLAHPAAPAWGYRLTQGTHVLTGIACIPLTLVKLWTVYPRLWRWPPIRSVAHAVERASLAVLVSVTLLQLGTGLANVLNWYPWPWSFVLVHYALAWVLIGSVLVHVGVKLPQIRSGLRVPVRESTRERARSAGGLSRRGLLVAAATGVGTVVVTTVGQTVRVLEPVALLAPRRPRQGPQGVPINKTAAQAAVEVSALAADYRLEVIGPNPYVLTRADLEALPRRTQRLPIACVEGWSVSAEWTGPTLLDVVRRAGGDEHSRVRVESLQQDGFRASVVEGGQLGKALLATHLNGERLHLDHGYPVRLIAPNRAGVLNTKWLAKVVIEE